MGPQSQVPGFAVNPFEAQVLYNNAKLQVDDGAGGGTTIMTGDEGVAGHCGLSIGP